MFFGQIASEQDVISHFSFQPNKKKNFIPQFFHPPNQIQMRETKISSILPLFHFLLKKKKISYIKFVWFRKESERKLVYFYLI